MRTLVRRSTAAVATLVLTGAALAGCGNGDTRSDDEILIGSILDVSGIQNISGQAMLNATKLAIKQWNAEGGILGKQVSLKFYDAQGDQSKYSQYATQLAMRDKPDVAMAGINSASREAIRPVFHRSKLLYFYNDLYEGGVCDKNTFATGLVPSQSLAALVPSVIEQHGKNVYIVAADYNFGQISGLWAREYTEEAGGTVVGEEYIPLESSSFSSVVDDIQRRSPDVVLSFLVGTNHTAFYRAFAAAGLNQDIRIASTVFGASGEHRVLSATESRNVTVAFGYFQGLDNPENKAFLRAYEKEYGAEALAAMTDSAITTWNGLHLWAAAVEEAGTTDREAVTKVLESGGLDFHSPSGAISFDGPSHHLVQPVSLAETDGKGGLKVLETKPGVEPRFETDSCDLIKDPSINQQFTPQ